MAEDQSGLSDLEKLQTAAADEDAYDTEADEEADRLEQSLLRERKSQVEQKKQHWQATEKREHRTIASQKEQTKTFSDLAGQLTSSEQAEWKDQWRGRD